MRGDQGAGGGVPGSSRVQPRGRGAAGDCPARHCWVGDATDGRGEKRPGLLVEWRSTSAGWEGRVVYVAQARGAEWVLVEEWLPGSSLTPA